MARCFRFGLAGALAGMLAGGLELVLVEGRAATFLPSGVLHLAFFLIGLYGVAGLIAGFGLGLVADLLAHGDVGLAVRVREDEEPRPGARLWAYAPVALAAAAATAIAARYVVEAALIQFHNRPLIGALSGAAAVGAGLGAILVGVLVAPSIGKLVPVGRRLKVGFRAPKLFFLPLLVLGLYAGAGAIAAHVIYLQQRPRMTPAMRALNAALAAPFFFALALFLAWLLYRATRLLAFARGRAGFWSVLSATLFSLLAPIVLAAAMTWSTTRQLDLRPFLAGGGIVLGAILLGSAWSPRRPGRWLLVLLPILAALLFVEGRVPRVRKAAALTGLAPELVRGVQLLTDLDRDGYASALGGGDCNDFDRGVHPGAFDWPDDGIDQNCNGQDATLKPVSARKYVTLPDAAPQQPNVVLITFDALRADHVSAYGYKRQTTPNLDALAKEGFRFDNAWAHAPSTRYSVPAILTGRYPSTIAVNNDPRVHWPPQVLPENRLFAEIMHDLGYRTAANLSYHYFERGWGLDQGFDDYDYHLETLHSQGGDPAATSGTSSKPLADLDIEWLKAHADKPFFLWTHFYDTHFRFEPHPDLPESNFGSSEVDLYDGEIRYADYHAGRVIDTLHELGLWDKTIVIVTSDHGDGFGEHGIPKNKRHGYHLYRTETKVPIIIYAPGLPPRVVATPMGHVDILPTVLNLLRRPESEEPQLFGGSMVGAMLGDDSQKDERAIYQEVWYEGPTSKTALATRSAHLLRNSVPEDTIELYDLVRDPAEEHDLSGLGNPLEATLLGRLGAITDTIAIPPDFAVYLKDAIGKTPTKPQLLLGDTLGDYLRVVGSDVDHASIRAGESAMVTVHFEVKRALPEGWVIFVRANGGMGRSMSLDHQPLEDLRPLTTLEPGSFVKDPIGVSVPAGWPAGPVRVELGLYHKGGRAPARGSHSAADAVSVASFQVTR